MDKRKDNGISLVLNEVLKCSTKEDAVEKGIKCLSLLDSDYHTFHKDEVFSVAKESELYNTVYKEISEIVGLDATLKIYLRFKGQQITFPVRLYNPNMIQQKVIKEFDGTNIRELAKKYDYSEKTIRRMIRDSLEEGSSSYYENDD